MLQITIDDSFEEEIKIKAKELGIDTKDFITSLLKDTFQEYMNKNEYIEFLNSFEKGLIEIKKIERGEIKAKSWKDVRKTL